MTTLSDLPKTYDDNNKSGKHPKLCHPERSEGSNPRSTLLGERLV